MQEDNSKLIWVSGDGGPLVLMEQKYLTNWKGSDVPSNNRVIEANSRWVLDINTDYDRACAIEYYLGLINIGEGKAIVLGGDDLATTWFPINENQEGLLIRWNYGNSESEVINFAKSLSNETENDEDVRFSIEDSN